MILSVFGPSDHLLAAISEDLDRDGHTLLQGTIKSHGSTFLLCDPRHVPHAYRDRLVPRYPRLQKPLAAPLPFEITDAELTAATDRLYTLAFEGYPEAAPRLCGIPYERAHEFVERALKAVHYPVSAEKAQLAIDALDRLGAWISVRALQSTQSRATRAPALPIRSLLSPRDLETRSGLQFTPDQRTALKEILTDIAAPNAMRRLLSGDVGTGKTAVFGLAAIAAAHAGAQVAVLLPSEHLARQVVGVLSAWAADLTVGLVLGDATPPAGASILVGTTALLHLADLHPDLLIIDEQQAFGYEQRQALLSLKADRTAHLLEVTATCVPRSQAIAQMGFMSVSRLVQCHVEKKIETTLFLRKEGRLLFEQVGQTIAQGGKVLVIYPSKGGDADANHPARADDGQASPPLLAAIDELPLWEKHYPGRVAAVASASNLIVAQRNQAAIEAFATGTLPILLSTTLLERGVDIPGLNHVVIVQPDRFGLAQLHQIRGRVARAGGLGRCDLFAPYPLQPPARRRVQRLMALSDGWEIARADAEDRGAGDLAVGSTQHGETPGPFPGRLVRQEHLDFAVELLDHASK